MGLNTTFSITKNTEDHLHPNIILVNKHSKTDKVSFDEASYQFGKITYYKKRTEAENDLIIVGVGDDTPDYKYRSLGGNVYNYLNSMEFSYVNISLKNIHLTKENLQSFLEGWILRANKLDTYKNKKYKNYINNINFNISDEIDINEVYTNASKVAESIFLARHITNEPANRFNAETFVSQVRNRFKNHNDVNIKVYTDEDLVNNKMVGLLSVSKGSNKKPALIEISYQKDLTKPLISLVGKGMTVDMGGYNVKTGKDISGIRVDMGGASAVFGALDLLVKTEAKVNVVGIIVTTENLINSNALVPGDVIEYPNDLSVQVCNTDAEGRLILADGLIHAQNKKSNVIVDIATLTGTVGAALGNKLAGLWGDEEIVDKLKTSAKETGENVWHMPLVEAYNKSLNSTYADIKNLSSMSLGGAITAALFLKKFIKDGKWAHLDIAAMVESDCDEDEFVRGTTGFGVRLLSNFVENYK